jgi:Tfp pilus assembly PilM family ATPase
MSKTICIDCDPKEMRIAVGTSGLTGVSIEHLLRAPLDLAPEEDYLDNPKTLAAAQSLLRQANIKSGNAVVCIGRSSVELRSLQLPSSNKDELPDMVRFAAQRHFANVGDTWPIDFVTLKSEGDTTEILAAAINPARIERLSRLIESCGLKLGQLVLRPMVACAVALAKRADLSNANTLFVDLLNEEADMAITEAKSVVFMRTIRFNTEQDEQSKVRTLSSEIKRTLLAAASQQSQLKVDRVLIWGSKSNTSNLCQALSQSLDMPVESIDPFELIDVTSKAKQEAGDDRGRYAAVIGGMLAPNLSESLIDFQNPRKRTEAKRPIRAMALAVTAASLVVGAGVYWYFSSHWEMDAKIAVLNKTIESQKKLVESANKSTAQWARIESFLSGRFSLLDELEFMSKNALEPDKVIYRDTTFSLEQKKNEGVISARYVTPEQANKTEIETRLRGDDRTVTSTGFLNNPDKNSKYAWIGDLSIRLNPRKVDDVRKWKDVELITRVTPEPEDGKATANPTPTESKGTEDKPADNSPSPSDKVQESDAAPPKPPSESPKEPTPSPAVESKGAAS